MTLFTLCQKVINKYPPVNNKPPIGIKLSKFKIDLLIFTFKKVKAIAIKGNNNIILGIKAPNKQCQ